LLITERNCAQGCIIDLESSIAAYMFGKSTQETWKDIIKGENYLCTLQNYKSVVLLTLNKNAGLYQQLS